jgi:hypothetical protein
MFGSQLEDVRERWLKDRKEEGKSRIGKLKNMKTGNTPSFYALHKREKKKGKLLGGREGRTGLLGGRPSKCGGPVRGSTTRRSIETRCASFLLSKKREGGRALVLY